MTTKEVNDDWVDKNDHLPDQKASHFAQQNLRAFPMPFMSVLLPQTEGIRSRSQVNTSCINTEWLAIGRGTI